MTRKNQPHRFWESFQNFSKQFSAVHSRHPHVRYNHVERGFFHHLQRFRAAFHKDHFPFTAHRTQQSLQTLQHQGFVIDKKDALVHEPPEAANGSWIMNVVPLPTALSNEILPPCLSTITDREIASPWPVPFPTPFVVKNGSKIRPRIFSGIPAPVSWTRTSTQSRCRWVLTVMVPLPLLPSPTTSAMAWVALMIKFNMTWLNSPARQGTGGRFGSNRVTTSATYFHSLRATVIVLSIAWFKS